MSPNVIQSYMDRKIITESTIDSNANLEHSYTLSVQY